MAKAEAGSTDVRHPQGVMSLCMDGVILSSHSRFPVEETTMRGERSANRPLARPGAGSEDPAGRRPGSRRGSAWLAAGVACALLAAAGVVVAAPLDASVARYAPSGRFGTLPTPHTGPGMRNSVVDPADIGTHGYQVHQAESLGILYTCRAGFVDLDHVRDAADWTAYLRPRFLDALLHDRGGVHFPGKDRDVVFDVRLAPLDEADKARWAGPIATELARRHAYLLLTWHEVLTWFGYRTVFLFPEKVSAFSYEDTTSHLVGVEAGAAALASDAPWNAAVDQALAGQFAALGAVPRDGTWAAFASVEGRWFDPRSAWPSNAFVKRRDLDLGFDGQGMRPWLAPGVPGCESAVAATLMPDRLETLADGRFAAVAVTHLQPGPDGYWAKLFPGGRPTEEGRPIVAIDPKKHLAAVMARIRVEVLAELGPDADRP